MDDEAAAIDLEAEGVGLAQKVDYTASVLHTIDEQLAPFGLEVVILDASGDTMWWRVGEKR